MVFLLSNSFSVFFENIRPKAFSVLRQYFHIHNALKVNMVVVGRYFLPTQETSREKSFNTANQIITLGCDLEDAYERFVEEMKVQTADFQEKDSGIY